MKKFLDRYLFSRLGLQMLFSVVAIALGRVQFRPDRLARHRVPDGDAHARVRSVLRRPSLRELARAGQVQFASGVRRQGVASVRAHARRHGADALRQSAARRQDRRAGEHPPSQLSDICPFAERAAAAELPKSKLLRRKVFKKVAKDKVMLQKFVAWKTNKESDPRYPAYVFHYTDYSSGRKDPLKKDIRVAPTEAQITAIFDAFLAENVKKGWEEVVG